MLTTKEAAELLGITPRRVQELIRNGALTARLPYLKEALTWRLRRMIDIAEWS